MTRGQSSDNMLHAMADVLNSGNYKLPSRFLSDLMWDAVSVYKSPEPFVWMLRECGTQICRDTYMMDSCVDTWPDYLHLFWVSDIGEFPHKGTCREISVNEARALLKDRMGQNDPA